MADVTGIAGSQSRAKTDATSARTTSKKFLLSKVGKWTAGVFVILALLFWWKSLPSLTSMSPFASGTTQRAVTTPGTSASVTYDAPTWETAGENGYLPMNEWSNTYQLRLGCKTDYDSGLGTDFKVRYRFHSDEWNDLTPGTWPKANEVQFMIINQRKEIPIRVTCS